MKCTQIVIVKVSPRAGHIKSFWVQEVRPDGWVRAHYEQDQHPFLGTWFAPHNVVCFTEPHFNYDYGGIPEGTLVQNIDVVGMVVRRRGAVYDVLIDGKIKTLDWSSIRPVGDPCNETGV